MKEYDKLVNIWKPFVMFFNQANFKSRVYNLDKFGFRFNDLSNLKNLDLEKDNSIFNEKIFSKSKETASLVGGSSAFGTGASSDSFTVSSILSKKTNTHFFNLGCSAFSGFQEIILFQTFINLLKNTKKVIIFSGLNDIFLTHYLSTFDPVFGFHYFSQRYIEGMIQSTLSWKRNLVKSIFGPFIKHNANWNSVTRKQLLNFLLKKNEFKKPDLSNKKEILKDLVEKNFQFWANIQRGMGIKIIYALQPCANWCEKDFSDEEKEIFSVTDTTTQRPYQIWKMLDKTLYTYYKNLIEENCNHFNFDFVDCNDYFSNNNFNKQWLFVDRAHLTDLGNEKVAELIMSRL
jgi:hypothetical protein